MSIDDKVKGKCNHSEIYIIGIEKEDEVYRGQYWYNCTDCGTTGLDPLQGFKATLREYNGKYIYTREKSYIPTFMRRDE